MSNVIRLPLSSQARARVGSKLRAERRAKSTAVKPAARARRVPKTADHQGDGMLSRCHHFLTFSAVQLEPTSAAMSAYDGQTAMTSRKSFGFDMSESLGHFVPNDKNRVSRDCALRREDTAAMSKNPPKSTYKLEFIERVKAARTARGYTQQQISELLGIDQGKYKQYESRSYLPHDLMPRFCIACSVDPAWLITGKGRMTAAPTAPRETPAKPAPRKRGKAA